MNETKRIGLSLIDWPHVGATLANEGSNAQVAFLKAFLRECSTWGTRLQVEKQFAYINAELTDSEREALAMLSYKETAR